MGKRERVPVTMRALMQRINRKLRADDRQLRAARGEGNARHALGDFYLVDFNRNAVIEKDVDPEALGRELAVLRPWEQIVKEGDKR